jgi:hypothetical protein
MTAARFLVGDVFDRMAELPDHSALDCGHPDTTPDTWHTTPNGHTVCPDCCPQCNERPA